MIPIALQSTALDRKRAGKFPVEHAGTRGDRIYSELSSKLCVCEANTKRPREKNGNLNEAGRVQIITINDELYSVYRKLITLTN